MFINYHLMYFSQTFKNKKPQCNKNEYFEAQLYNQLLIKNRRMPEKVVLPIIFNFSEII